MNTWVNPAGMKILYSDMDDSYLFNTIKMIWNYMADTSDKIHPYNNYALEEMYKIEFLAESIKSMVDELNSRDNKKFKWDADLNRLRYFKAEMLYKEMDEIISYDNSKNKIKYSRKYSNFSFLFKIKVEIPPFK